MAKQSNYTLACHAMSCGYVAVVGSKREADRAAKVHASLTGGEHDVIVTEEIPLPHAPMVGDRIKLKADRLAEYQKACAAAGWENADLETPKVVIRDESNIQARMRIGALYFEGAPFSYYQNDVTLAWNTVAERREALRKAGHRV